VVGVTHIRKKEILPCIPTVVKQMTDANSLEPRTVPALVALIGHLLALTRAAPRDTTCSMTRNCGEAVSTIESPTLSAIDLMDRKTIGFDEVGWMFSHQPIYGGLSLAFVW
jgi:hypothetical protein